MDSDEIRDVLERIGVDDTEIREHNSPRGRQIMIRCPLAQWTHAKGFEGKPSFTIKVEPEGRSVFRCWSGSCGHYGTLAHLLFLWWKHGKEDRTPEENKQIAQWVERVRETDQATLEAQIEKTADLFKPWQPAKKKEDKPPVDHDVFNDVEIEDFLKEGPPQVFFDRGFTKEDADFWEIGFDTDMSRITFPVRKQGGKLVGCIGRATRKRDIAFRKYYNYWNFSASQYLYGEHMLSPDVEGIILVEGATDAIRVNRAIRLHGKGTPFEKFLCVAWLGDQLKEDQARRVLMWRLPVYIFPDNDDDGAGKAGARKSVKLLEGRAPVFVVPTPIGKDPGAIEEDLEVLRLLDESSVAEAVV